MIYLGTIQATATGVVLVPPLGFNTVLYCRVSNLSQSTVTLFNINPGNSSTQYLLPNSQNIYQATNTAQNPVAQSQNDTPAVLAAELFVEWSTEPSLDFPGSYPCPITVTAPVTAQAIYQLGVPAQVGWHELAKNELLSINNGFAITSGWQQYDLSNVLPYVPGILFDKGGHAGTHPFTWTPTQIGGFGSLYLSFANSKGTASAVTVEFSQELHYGSGLPPAPLPPSPQYPMATLTYSMLTSQAFGTNLDTNPPQLSVALPILGPFVTLYETTPVNQSLIVNAAASSQPYSGPPILLQKSTVIMFSPGPFVSGVGITLVDGSSARDYLISNANSTQYTLLSTGAGGSWFMDWVDEFGVTQSVVFAVSVAGTRLFGTLTLPQGMIRVHFLPSATIAGTASMTLNQQVV